VTTVFRRNLRAAALFITIAATVLHSPHVRAFGGEDPVLGNPWHHEAISRDAAKAAGFTFNPRIDSEPAPIPGLATAFKPDPRRTGDRAAEAIAWHADYVDSYLYNPLWWAPGGIGRFKVALATAPELEKVHFDDLFDANKVRYMWRRYVSGTMAGLKWARDHDDVAAAQNIVGVSLHALQDFYSHSNWIDDPSRRPVTFFSTPLNSRISLPLYTGAYEQEAHQGIKHHGKYLFEATIMNQPGVRQILSVVCGPGSPLGNSDMCKAYDAATSGTAVRFEVRGAKIPDNVIYQAPTGIALDNLWLAEIGVRERGLTGLTGAQAFAIARGLAVETSKQWLLTLEANMKKDGEASAKFWNRVKTEGTDQPIREKQFEDYSKFPYTFLSAGKYPPEELSAEEYFLRVRLRTARDSGAGTDADIDLRPNGVDSSPPTLLDYMPRANPIIAYNDFEQGDDISYVAGPFPQLPRTIDLFNDSGTTGEVLKQLGKTLLSAVLLPFKTIGSIFTTILGSDADWIGVTHKTWTPEELAAVPTAAEAPGKVVKIPLTTKTVTLPAGQEFTLPVDGGERGYYKTKGYIVKTAESAPGDPQGWREFQVILSTLDCVKESKWDRGSSSDEPFVLALLKALPGTKEAVKTQPFDDVDAGESRSIGHTFQRVRIPKEYGMLNCAVSFNEHDDESAAKRQAMLDEFSGSVDRASEKEERNLVAAVGAAVGEDWKLEHISVYAWSRGGVIRTGTVLDQAANRWIKGRQSASFTLDAGKLETSPVHTDDLLPYIAPTNAGTQTPPVNTGTQTPPADKGDPGSPNTANPSAGQGDGAGVGGGTGSTGSAGGTTFTGLKTLQYRIDGVRVLSNGQLQVLVTYKNSNTKPVAITSGINFYIVDADGIGIRDAGSLYRASGDIPETISQTVRLDKDDEVKVSYLFNLPKGITGLRTLYISEEGVVQQRDLSGVSIPGAADPAVTPGDAVGGTGGFVPIGDFDVRFDGMRKGRGSTLHAFVTVRNEGSKPLRLTTSEIHLSFKDAEGINTRSNGNLYRASGGSEPEPVSHSIHVMPKTETRIRYVFNLGKGSVPQTLTINDPYSDDKQVYSLPALP
jgi:hypothetical protein